MGHDRVRGFVNKLREGCSKWLTKQWRCILPDTDFKNFKPRAAADASRIIIGWPTSAENLYDAFSKTSAKSCAHSQHSAHFWHILVAAEKVFLILFWRQYVSCYIPLCCFTASTYQHLHSKVCRGLSAKKMSQKGFSLLCLRLSITLFQ